MHCGTEKGGKISSNLHPFLYNKAYESPHLISPQNGINSKINEILWYNKRHGWVGIYIYGTLTAICTQTLVINVKWLTLTRHKIFSSIANQTLYKILKKLNVHVMKNPFCGVGDVRLVLVQVTLGSSRESLPQRKRTASGFGLTQRLIIKRTIRYSQPHTPPTWHIGTMQLKLLE